MSTAKDSQSGHPKHSPDHPGRAADSQHAEAPTEARTEAPTEARMPGERQTEGGRNSVSRRVLLAGTAAFAVGASARSVAAAAGGGHEHHDHMVCTECEKILEFRDDELERRQELAAKRVGFRIQRHSLRLYGTCKQCQQEQRKK